MKLLVTLAALAATVASQAIQFKNTSFAGDVTTGQVWPISWTMGNGLPVTLLIGNSTWNIPIFVQRSVLPDTYALTLTVPTGFVPGIYQLALQQIDNDAGTTYSPYFNVLVAASSGSVGSGSTITPTNTGLVPTATGWTPVKTITVTYVYFDQKCSCTKTTTAASPLGTGIAHTTYSWFEPQCGCTKSAVVPVAPAAGTNNYTAPAEPPVASAPGTTSFATNSPHEGPAESVGPTKSSGTSTNAFRGGAVKMTSSTFGMLALIAAAVLA